MVLTFFPFSLLSFTRSSHGVFLFYLGSYLGDMLMCQARSGLNGIVKILFSAIMRFLTLIEIKLIYKIVEIEVINMMVELKFFLPLLENFWNDRSIHQNIGTSSNANPFVLVIVGTNLQFVLQLSL